MPQIKKSTLFKCLGILGVILVGSIITTLLIATHDQALKTVEQKGGLAILNHPGRYEQPDEWYIEKYDRFPNILIGMEVYNQGDRYPNDRNLWDRINKVRDPTKLIWGYSNDDYHQPEHSFRNYQYMLMPELTEAALRVAMLAGASYFCYEKDGANTSSPTYGYAATPIIQNIVVNISSLIITITGVNYTEILWFNDASENFINGTAVNVSDLDSNFVRAVLINEWGKSYTQPFGLTTNGIVNPYAGVNWGTFHQYKANFHTHTTESDVKDSPNDVIAHYNGAGYQILAITDHNQNTFPWSKWIDETPQNSSSSSEFFPNMKMLAISGNELSASHHTGVFFTNYRGNGFCWRWELKID
jgi:hypothetical protein